ncbi:hypothetical protein BpHYR1_011350 [Brachionus plicatilis]|uniref:Uncharacterized protein n=1 Tax=Brachionus plicatilis TaxID=10195 RepID=A0A3M7SLL9_BRAPC|nr:hypothetical protein BpHYR1_011350 [Brachionus plicatilis]
MIFLGAQRGIRTLSGNCGFQTCSKLNEQIGNTSLKSRENPLMWKTLLNSLTFMCTGTLLEKIIFYK